MVALEVDATALHLCGGGGLALLRFLKTGGFTPAANVTVRGLDGDLDQLLLLFADENSEAAPSGHRRTPSLPEEIGASARGFARDLREQVAFLGNMAAELAGAMLHPERFRWKEVKRLCIAAGANALPIVSLLSLLVGLMIAFESAGPLAQFGAQIFIANMVGFGAVRELGPMMTAIMLAGRSGAAFAAEIGTMKVNEELAALTTMGLDPIRFLALQRVAAGILLTPLLTVYTMFTGVLGGTLRHAVAGVFDSRDLSSNGDAGSFARHRDWAGQERGVRRHFFSGGLFARVPDRARPDRGRGFGDASGGYQHFPDHPGRHGVRRGRLPSELMNGESDIVIAVRHLAAGYGDRQILRDISFEVRRGEVFVIIGGSGCGKSTLLKHMIGLFPPRRGEVWIEGENSSA